MKCTQCQADNREERQFCAKCGAPLNPMCCPDCGFANERGEEFCGGCGKALAPSISKTKRKSLKPERRQLTVMFCDLVGSTTLAERLDPEELHALLAYYQDTCAEVIHHYEGYIARYVGDGLLVYFGYPQAHEDDPQRGVRAGLGIVEAIRNLGPKIQNPDVNLAVRIGIATGLVVAGDIGSGERVEEKAIVGETPNLAARLQVLAEPNSLVIGGSTERLVEGLFECYDLGFQNLKGISGPVSVYRVRGESDAPSRFEAKALQGLTPVVGREEEIGLLFKRWSEAKDGEGRVILISGEAGIGKSRLLLGFRERLEDDSHNRILYYCSPYHQNSAFYPAIDQLQRGLRFESGDRPEQKFDKLERVLSEFDLPVAEHAPVLASLLAVPVNSRYPELDFAPQELRQHTLKALLAVFEAMAARDTVLMVVEDAHWIDPSTKEFLGLLIERTLSVKVLVVVTFRPDFISPWSEYGHVTSLALNRLSRPECLVLIGNVTRGKTLPAEVLDPIITRTDGIPLFIEELTKTMLDSGLLDDKGEYFELNSPLPPLAIPTSLQDSLTARLDRLPSISKELAQLAATIGRIFRHELLTLVSPMSEKDLVDALAQLLEVGLIYRRGLGNDVAYEFKHVLVQEAAYQLLLKSTRKQFHQRIAQVLAEQFPQTAESQPELLAHHYTESGLVEQAIPYWQHAGRRAIEHSANLEAVAHLYRALDLLNTLPESIEHTQQELAIQLSLGPTLMVIKGWGAEEVEQAYNRARELTGNLEDQFQERPRLRRLTRIPLLFGTLWGLWLMNWVKGRNRKARRLVNELLALAEQRSNQALLLQAHHAAWTTDFARGQLDSCLFHAEQGFALYNRKNHRSHKYIYGGHDPAVCSQTFASITQWLVGHPDKALESVQAAIAMAQELDHPPSFLHILAISACRIHLFRREPQLVIQNAEETIALAKKHHLALYMLIGQFWRDWALVELGQTEGMIEKMRSVIDSARARGVKSHIPFVNAITAEVCTKAGRYKEGLELLDEAQAIAEQNDESWWDAEIYRMRGEILLSSSDEKQRDAEAYFHKAIEIARVQASKSLELRGATSLGRLWRDQGRREEARKSLGPIYDWFTEGFDTADLKEAKALLDDLA